MKTSKIMATGASFLAAAMLFAGCAGVTHEPKVDMAAQADIDDAAFTAALEKIGVDESYLDVMTDTSFSFAGDSTDFEVVINIDATSDKENQYSYTKCVDEATAKALFDFYYDDAIYLKGDTVIVAISSDYDLTIEKEVNDFLDALGYPHP